MVYRDTHIKGLIEKEQNGGRFHCEGEQCDFKKCCKKYKKPEKKHCKKCPKR